MSAAARAGWLQRLRQRLHRVEETAVRTQQMQETLDRLTIEMAQDRATLNTLTLLGASIESVRSETDAGLDRLRDDLRADVAAVNGVATHVQTLSGEALSSTNVLRSDGLHFLDLTRQALGRIEARQLRLAGERGWRENEFRVYSQYGEDGLIQFLTRVVPMPRRVFVEFGVEDYREANTRFLLLNDHWSGLVMDGSPENIAAIKSDVAYLRRDLRAQAAFVTRENIDDLLAQNGTVGEIGLLSIDVDGMDYWIWEATTSVEPAIVVVEYNYRFGAELSVVVPYRADFSKEEAHPSGIYYGASLGALCRLAARKGYAFVGCSTGGVNAFFVRRDLLPASLPEATVAAGFVAGYHAEMRDAVTGAAVKASLEEQQQLLLTLPLETIGD